MRTKEERIRDLKEQATAKTLPCKRCNGTGREKYSWEEFDRECSRCGGTGIFKNPIDDFGAMLKLMTGRKGIRTSFPFEMQGKNPRAYFIWRMARFHGGKDVCMPVMADMRISGDPYEDLLDHMASELAKKAFGTDMAAAYRWFNALGGSLKIPSGMPETAYSCGPVSDGHSDMD